jgi:hypothetical protein
VQFFIEIVGSAAGCDFNNEFGGALDVVILAYSGGLASEGFISGIIVESSIYVDRSQRDDFSNDGAILPLIISASLVSSANLWQKAITRI